MRADNLESLARPGTTASRDALVRSEACSMILLRASRRGERRSKEKEKRKYWAVSYVASNNFI